MLNELKTKYGYSRREVATKMGVHVRELWGVIEDEAALTKLREVYKELATEERIKELQARRREFCETVNMLVEYGYALSTIGNAIGRNKASMIELMNTDKIIPEKPFNRLREKKDELLQPKPAPVVVIDEEELRRRDERAKRWNKAINYLMNELGYTVTQIYRAQSTFSITTFRTYIKNSSLVPREEIVRVVEAVAENTEPCYDSRHSKAICRELKRADKLGLRIEEIAEVANIPLERLEEIEYNHTLASKVERIAVFDAVEQIDDSHTDVKAMCAEATRLKVEFLNKGYTFSQLVRRSGMSEACVRQYTSNKLDKCNRRTAYKVLSRLQDVLASRR